MSGSWLGRPLRMGPVSSRATTARSLRRCTRRAESFPSILLGTGAHVTSTPAPGLARCPFPLRTAGHRGRECCAGGLPCSGLAGTGAEWALCPPVGPGSLQTMEGTEVGATAESAADQSAGTLAGRLGLRAGQVVQEFGYDD